MNKQRHVFENLLTTIQDSRKAISATGETAIYLYPSINQCLRELNVLHIASFDDRISIRRSIDYFGERCPTPSVERFHGELDKLTEIVKRVLNQPEVMTNQFSFIGDIEIQKILERDIFEASRCLEYSLFKSCIVMCGSILEAALFGKLRNNPTWTNSAARNWDAFRDKKGNIDSPEPIESNSRTKWQLAKLIGFSCDNQVLNAIKWKETLHQFLREPRNLVHATAELRKEYEANKDAAQSSLSILNCVLNALKDSPLPP